MHGHFVRLVHFFVGKQTFSFQIKVCIISKNEEKRNNYGFFDTANAYVGENNKIPSAADADGADVQRPELFLRI